MMSVLARRFDDVKAGTAPCNCSSRIAMDRRRRSAPRFIYVDDVVRVMMWLLATPAVSGLFNVGTGTARSFRDLMLSATRRSQANPTSSISTSRTDSRQLQ